MAKKSSTSNSTGSKPVVRNGNNSRGSVNPSGKTLNKVTFEGPTKPPSGSKIINKK